MEICIDFVYDRPENDCEFQDKTQLSNSNSKKSHLNIEESKLIIEENKDSGNQDDQSIAISKSIRFQANPNKNLIFSIVELTNEGISSVPPDKTFEEFIKKYDLIILVTSYNEGSEEYKSTIQDGIDNNIEDLLKNGCENICVIVIVDGLIPFFDASKTHDFENNDKKKCKKCKIIEDNKAGCIHDTYFDQYTDINMLKVQVDYINSNGKLRHHETEGFTQAYKILEIKKGKSGNPRAYLFSQTISLDNKISYDMIFCIKEDNKRKINTHSWFLKGFCKTLKPNFIIFLDVGTKPLKKSLASLYKCLKNNENIAGCCGEIVPVIKNKWNFVEQAQKVEYKLSHIFDKAMESLFGYVSVLPGAFSAYRFKCLNRDEIFDAYFYTEYTKRISMFDANMYLAEDRILCLGLVCLSGEKFILKYVSESRAETDVPDEVYSLMVQRRRWNNGAWFSSIYTILNWTRICKSGHSILRKSCFIILMMYYVLVAIFSWVLVGGFYLCFSISLKKNLGEDNNDLNKLEKFSTPIIMFYVSTLIALGICSLSSKPQEIKSFLNLISFIYGLFTVATIVLTCLFIFKSGFSIESDKLRESTSILMLSFLLLLIILNIFMNGFKTLKSVMSGFIQFLFLSGTYVNIFLIYSICNIHDVSWGNRPGGEATEDEQKISFEKQRITWLTVWIISNISFAYFLNWLSGNDDENARKFILYFGWLTCGIIFVKVLAGIIYILAKCECIKH